jgi:hypothetical protein
MKLSSPKPIGFLLFLLLTGPVHAQFTILPSREGRTLQEEKNLTYSLPQHTLAFQVEVRRVVWEPGRFSAYADDLLGLKDVVNSQSTAYGLGRIRLRSIAEPDPHQRYVLPRSSELRKGGEDVAVFADNGVLIYYGRNSFAPRQAHTHEHLHNETAGWVSLTDKSPELAMNASSSRPDTVFKTIQRPDTLIRQAVVKQIASTKSEIELAREMANRYLDLKEAQLRLLTGYQEVNYSDAALRYMYERLDDEAEACLRLFTGTQVVETRTYTYTIIPQFDRDSVWVPLFRFSESKGAFPASGNQGDIVYVRWKGGKLLPAKNKLPEQGTLQTDETRSNLWYRIPVETSISLRMNNEILYQGTEHIAQLGLLQSLPYNKISVEFDPHSGQLVRVIIDN